MNLPPIDPARRCFLDISEFSLDQLRGVLDRAVDIKRRRRKGRPSPDKPLEGRMLAMIFDKPSTRTRVSFDVGMRELGGETLMLTGAEMQLGRGETIADTARVLSRFVDAIMIRILAHEHLMEMAAYATVPVINGLTKKTHPCQVMADIMTYEEHRGDIAGARVAWIGDACNVLTSWVHAAARFGFTLDIASPEELAPRPELIAWARSQGGVVNVMRDPYEAVQDANCVLTDCWVSMGDKDEKLRHMLLAPYQVNSKLMRHADKDAVFMHCLPAHRGEEVTDEVIDGAQSLVFDEAENRLHAQKGVLAWCMEGDA
ncbi:ornithine carbamoyltransferase [Rhodoblastus acidophilus]|uniref:Ornithine carbamoyltransferase n=1 Tax=Candidatus Rhodoblastus alkanivorans TaxID=2954117 RepID=A0ABS9Z5J8_9HYPH|nr:ornithine carbamoyltransferase [Candidatus Rhodoblastus alkanivorans]MCI4677598.1 ornithine carbamoyltransferase [Candidatus Rhodoblastus alkanivorans]MCI4682670.1 ornithine carbamoyltransferase [Candidatus Rhodoblastus alkanivorans]MDI4639977.1 ornithine carbamoyltransferase [Rhodoblastus acidophilus]